MGALKGFIKARSALCLGESANILKSVDTLQSEATHRSKHFRRGKKKTFAVVPKPLEFELRTWLVLGPVAKPLHHGGSRRMVAAMFPDLSRPVCSKFPCPPGLPHVRGLPA